MQDENYFGFIVQKSKGRKRKYIDFFKIDKNKLQKFLQIKYREMKQKK